MVRYGTVTSIIQVGGASGGSDHVGVPRVVRHCWVDAQHVAEKAYITPARDNRNSDSISMDYFKSLFRGSCTDNLSRVQLF